MRATCMRLAVVVLAALLAAGLVVSLSGCKYTDVLTEHIEDEELGELDPEQDPIYVEDADAPEDPLQSSNEVQDSERTDLQEELTPIYDEDAEENGVAVQRIYDPDSPFSKMATEGSEYVEQEEEKQSEEVEEDADSEQTQESTSDEESEEETTEDTVAEAEESGEAEGEDEGSMTISAGIGGTGTVYDASGETQELPEDCSKVAAAGVYATIVQMVAGEGGLVACDSYWQEQVASRGLFPDEGVENLALAWESDEDGNYTLDVDALIAAEPDAILIDGVNYSLTTKQTETIQAASIDIITVPQLGELYTSDSYVVDAVNVVGELLKNSTTVTYNTQSAAAAYETMHDSVIDSCVDANGGYTVKSIGGTAWSEIYQDTSGKGTGTTVSSPSNNRISTVYFASWTSSAVSSITADRSYSSATLEYLHDAVVDTSDGVGLSATVVNKSFVLLDYYLQVSGVVNNAYDYKRPRTSSSGESYPYVLVAGSSSGLVSGLSLNSRSIPSALWYTTTTIQVGTTWSCVGDSDFPGVIAATTDIAKSIVSSANKTNGLYNVGQSYDVYVMPSGIDGSWACGTPESYLASAWALKTFWGISDVETFADSAVEQFYSTFYRVSSNATSVVSNYEKTYVASCPTS